jgi:hypothetical protein
MKGVTAMFSAPEVEFLMKGHGSAEGRGGRVEHADGVRSLEGVDFRGCPQRVMQIILEKRAKLLGPAFEHFQREQAGKAVPNLDSRIAASKLF